MNLYKHLLLIVMFCTTSIATTQASTVVLPTTIPWAEFNIDDASAVSGGTEWIDLTDSNSANFGTPSSYTFTIASGFKGLLQVVDGGFAGDRFEVFSNGQSLGLTSTTENSTDYSNNFSSNFSNANFSRGFFNLTEGTHSISGKLFSTNQPFNATNGALQLEITSVPLPNSFGLLFCALSLLGLLRRRRV